MTGSAYVEGGWNFTDFAPQPQGDSELLHQLGFLPGLKALLMTRQVHALEHATVWLLSRETASNQTADNSPDNENLGGLSTENGFYLYGQVKRRNLHEAVRQALLRLKQGEWNLAIHPRCGTNLSVALILTAGFVLGVNTLLPKDPFGQLIGLGIATTTASQIAPDLGQSVQRYITTAIPFNLEVVEISPTQDFWGRSAYFVRVRWCDLQ